MRKLSIMLLLMLVFTLTGCSNTQDNVNINDLQKQESEEVIGEIEESDQNQDDVTDAAVSTENQYWHELNHAFLQEELIEEKEAAADENANKHNCPYCNEEVIQSRCFQEGSSCRNCRYGINNRSLGIAYINIDDRDSYVTVVQNRCEFCKITSDNSKYLLVNGKGYCFDTGCQNKEIGWTCDKCGGISCNKDGEFCYTPKVENDMKTCAFCDDVATTTFDVYPSCEKHSDGIVSCIECGYGLSVYHAETMLASGIFYCGSYDCINYTPELKNFSPSISKK